MVGQRDKEIEKIQKMKYMDLKVELAENPTTARRSNS